MNDSLDEIASVVRIAPAVWPDAKLDVDPGDLSKYLSFDYLTVPLVAPPARERHTLPMPDPVKGAPRIAGCGGIVYFQAWKHENLHSFSEAMGVCGHLRKYAAFASVAMNPREENYLVQLRIVSDFALNYAFRAPINERHLGFVEQTIAVEELLTLFVDQQQRYWKKHNLSKIMGFDGDCSIGSLSFGLMVENDYHFVYRIWSRIWRVCK